MTIKDWAQKCVGALRQEEYAVLLNLKDSVLPLLDDHPQFAPRFHGWWAQAHLSVREPEQALRHVNTAIRLAKQICDDEGVHQLKELQKQAVGMIGAIRAKKRGQPGLLEQALSAIEANDLLTGESLAEKALDEAIQQADPKMEILSLLTLVKLPHRREAALSRAYSRAQEIADTGLITAVKKAMDAIGKTPPPHIF